jgi:predicted nucleic-acid-binding Zn-ribbon protein
MPIAKKVVIECPKCGFTKVVTRGDCLPDASMFQKCPKCGDMMVDSEKSVEEASGILSTILGLFRK